MKCESTAATLEQTTPGAPEVKDKQVVRPANERSASRAPMFRPMRRARAVVVSAEARRIAEERDRKQIEAFISEGRVTQCDARWALGAVQTNLLGTDG